MPIPPRLRFPGAIYHIVTRGDGRRVIFHDDGDFARLTKGPADGRLGSRQPSRLRPPDRPQRICAIRHTV